MEQHQFSCCDFLHVVPIRPSISILSFVCSSVALQIKIESSSWIVCNSRPFWITDGKDELVEDHRVIFPHPSSCQTQPFQYFCIQTTLAACREHVLCRSSITKWSCGTPTLLIFLFPSTIMKSPPINSSGTVCSNRNRRRTSRKIMRSVPFGLLVKSCSIVVVRPVSRMSTWSNGFSP